MVESNGFEGEFSPLFYDDYVKGLVERRARRIAERCGMSNEAEDIQQEMFLEIFTAAKRYDPTMSSEHTFVDRVLCMFAKGFLKKYYISKRGEPNFVSHDDKVVLNNEAFVKHLVDPISIHLKLDIRKEVREYVESLPLKFQETCKAIMCCPSKRDAAKKLKISRSTLYVHIDALYKAFNDAGFKFLL